MSRIAKTAAVAVGTGAMMIGGAGMALADAGAHGKAEHSPGVASGNVVQVPINIPINLCGNTVDLIGLLNPAFGNTCVNKGDDKDHKHGDYGHGHDKGHGNGKGKDHGGYGD